MKLRIRQVLYILLAIAAFTLLILVVTNSQSPESLMNPPEAAGDYKEIQDVIEKELGDGIILKAPNEGAFTTAITFMDLNGDDDNDAVVFYRIKNDDTSTIYMSVLIKNDAKWITSQSVKGKGNDILEFTFGDLNYDAFPEIIVGWNMFDSKDHNSLCIYEVSVEQNAVQVAELDSLFYTKMFAADICSEGKTEILLINNKYNDELDTATASVLELEDNHLISISSVSLISAVSEYKKIQIQPIDQTNVFYLDGVVDNQNMITEILYWNQNERTLQSPTYQKDYTLVPTYRQGTVPSMDINDDGVIEIPFTVESADDAFINTTLWKRFRFDGYEDVARGICSDDLIFRFPAKWQANVAVMQTGNVWSFYDVSRAENAKLFDLVVTEIADWDRFSDNYDKLKINYGTIYGVKINATDSAYAVSKNEVEDFILNMN